MSLIWGCVSSWTFHIYHHFSCGSFIKTVFKGRFKTTCNCKNTKKKKTTRQQRCQPAIEFAETKLKCSAVMTLGEPDTRRVAVVIRCKGRGKSLTVPLVSSPLPLRPSSCSDTVQDGCSLEWANSECLPSWRKIVPAEHESLLAFSCPPTLDPVLLWLACGVTLL